MGSLLPGQVKGLVRSHGLVAPDVPLRRARLHGDYPNADVVASGSGGGMRAEAWTASGVGVCQWLEWEEFQARRKGGYGGRY